MIPELGHFAVILALCLAIVQAVVPLAGAYRNNAAWMAVARPVARAQFGFLLLAFACLAYSFVANDFSVLYVAQNSNSALPLPYKISAVWGAHEGSLLLWALILGTWTLAVSIFSRSLPDVLVSRVISVLGMVSIGFLLFILLTSNPFERLFPAALEGRDLNPLLQDPGLIMHPPMLYMGYVGFSVAFAFAIAALLGGQLDAAWARWSRPWTTIAWTFLTVGIALGSWWAYYELGWGGWWFWDPVENASFMPWLVGTALIHSLAVTEKRGAFKPWTVLLAIFAFTLCLLGTFLVRSGVLVSVHAFATDPARGIFILTFLAIVIGGSLTLYAFRAPQVRSSGHFSALSRETLLLVNNVLFVVAASSVLLGTLYPLIIDAMGLGKISVGPPYFASVFVPLMLPAAFLAGIGPLVKWRSDNAKAIMAKLRLGFVVAIAGSLAFLVFAGTPRHFLAALSLLVAFWVIFNSLQVLIRRVARRRGSKQFGLSQVPRGFFGMALAHMGIGIFIIGVTLVSTFHIERDIRMERGAELEVGGYVFRFLGAEEAAGPNYQAQRGTAVVSRNGNTVATMHPEKRVYRVQSNPMTEAAIDAGLLRDLYVSLGEPLEAGAWSVRIYFKPFIRWIWMGALFMALGGLLAATDRRYRVPVPKQMRSAVRAATVPSAAAQN